MANANNKTKNESDGTDGSKDDLDVMFNFFYNLAIKMILKRSEVGDECTFSHWLKTLKELKNKPLRNDYIKLMILALQHVKPMCPFKDPPPEVIEPLETGVIELSRQYLHGESTATCQGISEEPLSPNPSMSTAVSYDVRQYASCQFIPNVGVQCYYAFSDEPMYNWSMPQQISVPSRGSHARDNDWERALAGIVSYEESDEETEKPQKVDSTDNKSDKQDATSTRTTKTGTSKRRHKENEDRNTCNVMNIEQQNRIVTESFTWNDSSILTGDIIVGAEMISDKKVETHIKSQMEIDEDATNVYNRIYPGDFRIIVDPSIVEDITMAKKPPNIEGCETSMTCKEQQNTAKPQCCTGRGKSSVDTMTVNRQRAGNGNIKIPEDAIHRSGCAVIPAKKKDSQRKQKMTELSSDLAVRMADFNKSQKRSATESSPGTMTITTSVGCIETAKKPSSMQHPVGMVPSLSRTEEHASKEYGDRRHSANKESSTSFQRDSMNFQLGIDKARECVINARSLLRNGHKRHDNDSSRSDIDEMSDV